MTRTGPNARTTANPQPGMFIFTQNHYSLLRVNSAAARPELPPDQPTDKQLADAFRSITANSGSYEIKASEITLTPVVPKNPGGMNAGAFITGTFRMEGRDTLWVNLRARNRHPPGIASPQPTASNKSPYLGGQSGRAELSTDYGDIHRMTLMFPNPPRSQPPDRDLYPT